MKTIVSGAGAKPLLFFSYSQNINLKAALLSEAVIA